jgi:hypothetical protein
MQPEQAIGRACGERGRWGPAGRSLPRSAPIRLCRERGRWRGREDQGPKERAGAGGLFRCSVRVLLRWATGTHAVSVARLGRALQPSRATGCASQQRLPPGRGVARPAHAGPSFLMAD